MRFKDWPYLGVMVGKEAVKQKPKVVMKAVAAAAALCGV